MFSTETSSKRPVLYYMSSDDEVDDEFVRVAAEAEAKAKADEAEAAEPEPEPESEPKPEPESDSGDATAAETATLEEDEAAAEAGQLEEEKARSDAEAATEAQRVEAEDKAHSNEDLCEDGKRCWKPSSSLSFRRLLPPVESPEQSFCSSSLQHWDGFANTTTGYKILAGYSRSDHNTSLASFITCGSDERIVIWNNSESSLFIQRLDPSSDPGSFTGYSFDGLEEQKKLAITAATAWYYFMAKGRSVLADAVSASQHGSRLLMQNRTITVFVPSATGLSDVSSSSGAGAPPPGGNGSASTANQSNTPSEQPWISSALSSSVVPSPHDRGLSSASRAVAAAASKADGPSQRKLLPAGDILSIVGPPADQTEHSGSFFEIIANQKGWVTLVNAVTRAKLVKTYRPTKLAIIDADDEELLCWSAASSSSSDSRKRPADADAEMSQEGKELHDVRNESAKVTAMFKELEEQRKQVSAAEAAA